MGSLAARTATCWTFRHLWRVDAPTGICKDSSCRPVFDLIVPTGVRFDRTDQCCNLIVPINLWILWRRFLGFDFFACSSCFGVLGAATVDHQSIELRYHGSLTKTTRDAETTAEPAKRFDLYCLATPQSDGGKDVAFVIDEHGGGGWPWPARFGRVTTDAKGHPTKIKMRLLHEHNGTPYVLFVPFPYFEFADRLAKDARWEAPRESEFANERDVAPWKYRVAASARTGGRDCWRVDVTNNFGPQESVWVEKSSGLVVKAERRIVIGRGETHSLKMVLDSVLPLSNEAFERVNRPLPTLIRLQEDLKRPEDEKSPDLTEAQLGLAAAVLQDAANSGGCHPV